MKSHTRFQNLTPLMPCVKLIHLDRINRIFLLSLFFKLIVRPCHETPEALDGQNSLFDVGRSMFDVHFLVNP